MELMEKGHVVLGGVEVQPGKISALADLQSRGLAEFNRQGVPTTKNEEFKYTSLRTLTDLRLKRASHSTVEADHVAPYAFAEEGAIRVVLVNGRWDVEATTSLSHVPGLNIRALGCALEKDPGLVEHLGKLVKLEDFPFGALNTASFEEAMFIHIGKDVKVDQPIEIVHLTVTEVEPVACFPRLVVVAESGAEAVLVETYATIGSGVGLCCPVVEAFIHPNAQIEHVKVQRESLSSMHLALTEVRQERDSSYNNYSVTFGGKLTRNDLNVFLNGSNLHSRMDGIVVIDGEQLADNHTRLDHAYPHCDSFEVYKHVLDGHSTAVFNGKIYVHQDAQKTDAKQTNQTLLLSPTATMNSKPQLEIFADDVKCTHGATVGQLRSDAMFYLRSRAIPKEAAEAMLVYAFAAEVLEKIECEVVRDRLEAVLYEKLGASF